MLWNFGWVQSGRVAGMGLPDPEAWPLLAREGIGAVLSLTESEPPGNPEAAGLALLRVPIQDFGVPTDADLRRCVRFVREQVDAGKAVVVHCYAGRGRTGLVLAAWLVSEGMDADEAVRHVRLLRPGSIETPAQERLVHRYARRRRYGPPAPERAGGAEEGP